MALKGPMGFAINIDEIRVIRNSTTLEYFPRQRCEIKISHYRVIAH